MCYRCRNDFFRLEVVVMIIPIIYGHSQLRQPMIISLKGELIFKLL